MTTLVHLLLDVGGLMLAVLVVAAYRRRVHRDELEIRMLRSKVAELERHPAVTPRPRTIEKHRRFIAVSDDELDTATAREAAQHAAARERHEK